MLQFKTLPVLQDNYVHLIIHEDSKTALAVDPAESAPVIEYLEDNDLCLTHILNTHHHWDHIGGNKQLKRQYDCVIMAPASETERIPDIDMPVAEGDEVVFHGAVGQVFEVPGHTTGHVAYWFAAHNALFCGDALFSIGCGRLFEGTPDQMWHSLQKLRALPDDTRVFCAHEYTESNLKFALTIEPDNRALRDYAEEVRILRAKGKPSIPSLMLVEKAANPFLRADLPELQQAVGMSDVSPEQVFAEVRKRKDNF